jgi:hypothetical protein
MILEISVFDASFKIVILFDAYINSENEVIIDEVV